MNPTNPTGGGAKLPTDLQTRPVRRTEGAAPAEAATTATTEASTQSSSGASVSDSVQVTQKLIDATRAEVRRVDAEMIQHLRDAISNGTFEVNTDSLAMQMVHDALGVDLLSEESV